MEIGNQPLLSRFLRDGENADVTPTTMSKRENATEMQVPYVAKRKPAVSANSKVLEYFGSRCPRQGCRSTCVEA